MDSSDVIDLATRIQRRRDFAAHLFGFTAGAAVLAALRRKNVGSTTQFAASLLLWATALSAQHFRHVLRGPVTEYDVAAERARLGRRLDRPVLRLHRRRHCAG